MIVHPFRNLGLKALSVAIAVLIWLSVSGEQIVDRSLRVPLELENTPENLELVDIPPSSVDVRVRGPSGLLSHLAAGDIVAVLDLSTARPGRRLFSLTPDRVRGPSGVQVAQVSPSTIGLEFERLSSRWVRLVPDVEGQPAPGYAVESATCEPQSVEVVGPDTVLRQLNRVMTEPVSVAGASAPVRELVTIGVSAPGLRLRAPGKATVTVNIRPLPVERVVRGVPIRLRNLPAQRTGTVTPAEVTVDVKGAKEIVEGLTSERFAAWVDLADARPGRYNLQVHLDPPQRVDVVRVEPSTVAVRVK
jgi:YbbR domain-containing protein